MHPERDTTTGYHLFLEPEEPVRTDLLDVIKEFAGVYGGPVFPPHLTLLGPIAGSEEEIVRIATALAVKGEPLTLSLGACAAEEVFFRAFFIRVENSRALTHLREQACRVFECPEAPYTPHLSLFYGLPSETERRALFESFALPAQTVSVRALSIYRTEGSAPEWQRIARIPFGPMLD